MGLQLFVMGLYHMVSQQNRGHAGGCDGVHRFQWFNGCFLYFQKRGSEVGISRANAGARYGSKLPRVHWSRIKWISPAQKISNPQD